MAYLFIILYRCFRFLLSNLMEEMQFKYALTMKFNFCSFQYPGILEHLGALGESIYPIMPAEK